MVDGEVLVLVQPHLSVLIQNIAIPLLSLPLLYPLQVMVVEAWHLLVVEAWHLLPVVEAWHLLHPHYLWLVGYIRSRLVLHKSYLSIQEISFLCTIKMVHGGKQSLTEPMVSFPLTTWNCVNQ